MAPEGKTLGPQPGLELVPQDTLARPSHLRPRLPSVSRARVILRPFNPRPYAGPGPRPTHRLPLPRKEHPRMFADNQAPSSLPTRPRSHSLGRFILAAGRQGPRQLRELPTANGSATCEPRPRTSATHSRCCRKTRRSGLRARARSVARSRVRLAAAGQVLRRYREG